MFHILLCQFESLREGIFLCVERSRLRFGNGQGCFLGLGVKVMRLEGDAMRFCVR